jgi:hypothetical protein
MGSWRGVRGTVTMKQIRWRRVSAWASGLLCHCATVRVCALTYVDSLSGYGPSAEENAPKEGKGDGDDSRCISPTPLALDPAWEFCLLRQIVVYSLCLLERIPLLQTLAPATIYSVW